MAARLLLRVAFHLPLSFLSRSTLHRKTPRNVFKSTLLSSSPDVVKLRSQHMSPGQLDVILRRFYAEAISKSGDDHSNKSTLL